MFNREDKIVLHDNFGNKYVCLSDGSVESINGCFLKNGKLEPDAYGNNGYYADIDIKNRPLVLNLHDGKKLKFIAHDDLPNNSFPIKIVFEKYISKEGNRKIRLHDFNADFNHTGIERWDDETHDFVYTPLDKIFMEMHFFYNSGEDETPSAITCNELSEILVKPFVKKQHNADYLFITDGNNEYYMLDYRTDNLSKYYKHAGQDQFEQKWSINIPHAIGFCGCNKKSIDIETYNPDKNTSQIVRINKQQICKCKNNDMDKNDYSKIKFGTSKIFDEDFIRKDIIQKANDVPKGCNCWCGCSCSY